jgi:ABC-type bacteriocin/lantibiotic exporter with double-glycine peptidase domain
MLATIEAAFPILATLVIFAIMWGSQSHLLLNLGGFLAFFAAFGQTMAYVGTFAVGLSASLVAVPLLYRVRPLTKVETEVSGDRKSPGRLSGSLELSGVTFRYVPGGAPVLDNIALRIAAGEYVAIVGPSGSGKSSLFRLLLGFELPESGAIFYDGKALSTLDVTAIRAQIGTVLQSGQLRTGSVYDNICGGVQLPTERVWEAARLVGLEEDIKAMPMGMHTVIAEGISTFSGGQRQRIILARALAREPRILLLDEATSALDNRAQAIVQDTLRELDVTRVVIAHRLTTVRDADRIVVLSAGKIVQEGTYSELLEAKGLFSDFARRQLA